MSKSRAKGTAWETQIVRYLNTFARHVERRALAGSSDKGDIAGVLGTVIEAKSCARIELAAWVDEAEIEKDNADATLGVVWVKRKGKANPADGYVVMSGSQFLNILFETGRLVMRPESEVLT